MYFWKYTCLSKFNWPFQYPSILAFSFAHLVWSFFKHIFLMYTLASDLSELDRIRVAYFITWFEPPYCVIFHLLQRRISPVGEDGRKKLLNTCSWKFAQKKVSILWPVAFHPSTPAENHTEVVLCNMGWCSIIIPQDMSWYWGRKICQYTKWDFVQELFRGFAQQPSVHCKSGSHLRC